jgi:hypothetical protein
MIDWYNLFVNAPWIIAMALALAAFGYASWQASVQKEKFRVMVGQPGVQMTLNLAGILFSAGLAGSADVLWQRILWILLAIGFTFQLGVDLWRWWGKRGEEDDE